MMVECNRGYLDRIDNKAVDYCYLHDRICIDLTAQQQLELEKILQNCFEENSFDKLRHFMKDICMDYQIPDSYYPDEAHLYSNGLKFKIINFFYDISSHFFKLKLKIKEFFRKLKNKR